MEYRLHYQKKREIEYGNSAAFSRHSEQVRDMLHDAFDNTVYFIVDEKRGLGCDLYTDFMLSREAVEHVMKYAEAREGVAWVDDEDERNAYTWQDVADYFRTVLKETPKEYENIYFEWF